MKKIGLLFILFASVFFTSCLDDRHYYPEALVGSWVSLSNAKDNALSLTFYGDFVEVKNGSWDYRPFVADEYWRYYMTRDSVLHIYRNEYDYSDDECETESYRLDLSFSDSYNTLTLWYDPPFSSVRKYTFIRR